MEDDRDSRNYHRRSRSRSREKREDRRKTYSERDQHDRGRDVERRRERRRSRSRSKSRSRSRGRDRDRRRYDDDSRHSEDRSNSAEREESRRRQRQDKDWRFRLTSIRDAHFNRGKQPPTIAQNQFTNDGSFLEKFKQMTGGDNSSVSTVMPNSLVLASSSIQYNSEISLPPLTTTTLQPSTSSTGEEQDLDGVPMPTVKKPIPVPISVGRRRNVKPLKTGVVFKKTQQSEEDEASQEKLDAWERYLQEVQKYKQSNCGDEDASRPLVK